MALLFTGNFKKCIPLINTSLFEQLQKRIQFPKKPDCKDIWINATGRRSWTPTKWACTCSLHFHKRDFYQTTKSLHKLHADAIPILSLPSNIQENKLESASRSIDHGNKLAVSNSYTSPTTSQLNKNKLLVTSTTTSDVEPYNININDTSRKTKLKSELKKLKTLCDKQQQTIKYWYQKTSRQNAKIMDLKMILDSLHKQNILGENECCIFKQLCNNVKVTELVQRQICKRKGLPIKQTYSPELRSFALTLHFYSPRAYQYVRKTFDMCLPHAETVRKWYTSTNGVSGFSEEEFNALKLKAE